MKLAPDAGFLDRILARVAAAPEATACVAPEGNLSYRGFLALLSVVTAYFHREGVKPGAPVALTMSQSPLHVVAFLALARLGALVIPVSPFLRPEDKAALFAKLGIALAISDREDASVPGCRLMLLRSAHARGDEWRLDPSPFVPGHETPLRIALTSGTTGVPRGTLQTHGQFARRMERVGGADRDSPRFLPPNLHVTTALAQAVHTIAAGGTLVFPRGYDAMSFVDAVRTHGVTHVNLPPAHLAPMLDALADGGAGLPSIRQLLVIGDTPSAALLERAHRRMTPQVYVSYGITEVGRVALATPAMLASHPGNAGRPLPDARVEVVDAEGRVLEPGTAGLLRVAIDGMAGGYYGPDAADTSRFRDGWFHTGDIGRVSRDGYVYLEGRADDVINVGGRKVSPRFVESVLEDFPGVRDAAVFPAGEGLGGTRLAAAIVGDAALDFAALARFAASRLDVRAPAAWLEVPALPRTAAGKLLRSRLPAWIAANGKMVSGTK